MRKNKRSEIEPYINSNPITVDFQLMCDFGSIVSKVADRMNSKRMLLEEKLYKKSFGNHVYDDIYGQFGIDWDDYCDAYSLPFDYDEDISLSSVRKGKKKKQSKKGKGKRGTLDEYPRISSYKSIRFYKDVECQYDFEEFDSLDKFLKFCKSEGIHVSSSDMNYLKKESVIHCSIDPYERIHMGTLSLYCSSTYYSLLLSLSDETSSSRRNFI